MNKKDLSRKSIGKGKNAYDCVKEELKVLQALEHPNVIWLHEIIDDPNRDHIYLVTEYHSDGSIGDKVANINKSREIENKKLSKEGKPIETKGLNCSLVRTYLIDMIMALYYCHKVIGLIHRDIKPDNIMVNHNDEAVLIDFGISALVQETDFTVMDLKMGSYMFFAPELFDSSIYSSPSKDA